MCAGEHRKLEFLGYTSMHNERLGGCLMAELTSELILPQAKKKIAKGGR